jgi:hypothetical protein
MAIHAGTGEHAVLARSRRALESLKARVHGARMPADIVAIPANLRYPAGQELGMIAPMGGVAIEAVFFHGRMGPHVRASLFRVALVAEIVDPIPFHHLAPETSVVIVAVRAF